MSRKPMEMQLIGLANKKTQCLLKPGIGLYTAYLSSAVKWISTVHVVSTEFFRLNCSNYRFSMLKVTKNSRIWQLHQRGVNCLNTLVVLQSYL